MIRCNAHLAMDQLATSVCVFLFLFLARFYLLPLLHHLTIFTLRHTLSVPHGIRLATRLTRELLVSALLEIFAASQMMMRMTSKYDPPSDPLEGSYECRLKCMSTNSSLENGNAGHEAPHNGWVNP